jgi:hypothetical protein
VLSPLLKRQNEGLALGYVAARLVECTFALVGLLSLLAVIRFRIVKGFGVRAVQA